MEEQKVYIKTYCDAKEIKKILKLVNEFSRAVEKANSLADELARKEINVEISSSVRQFDRSKGIRFVRDLRQKFFHI